MVLRQISLLLKITPLEDPTCGQLLIKSVDAMQSLRLESTSFVVSLDLEPGDEGSSYAHGYIRSLDTGVIYPIRSSRSLYDAVQSYVSGAGEQE